MDLTVPPGGFMQPSMNNLPPSINMASFASLAGMDPSIVGMMELERQYGLNPLAGMVPNSSAASIHAPTYHLPSFPPQPYTMGTTNLIQQSIPSPGTPKSDSSGSTLPTEPVSMIDKFFETSRPGTPGTPPIVPGGASEHQFSPPSFSGINPIQGQPLQNFLERGFSSSEERPPLSQAQQQHPNHSTYNFQPMMPSMPSPLSNGTKHGLESSQEATFKKQKLSKDDLNSEALHDRTNTVPKKEPCPTKIIIKGSDWERKINVKKEPQDEEPELEEGEIIKDPERRALEERYYQEKDHSKDSSQTATIRVKKETQEGLSESDSPRTSTPTPGGNNVTTSPPINLTPGNLIPGNLTPGNLIPGNLIPGNLIPGNLTPGNIALQVNNRGRGVARARGTQRGRGARARGSALRGMNTGVRVANPNIRGGNPAIRGMNPAMRGINPTMRGMPPGMRGGMRGMHPGVRGINPGARGNNPRLRGMPPLTRGGVTRGGPRGGRGAMHNLIDIADSPPASPAKNPALDKLKACGISVSVQKTPEIPKGLNLPAGITICHAPTGYNGGSRNVKSSPTEPSSSKRTSFEKTSPSQKVSLTPNIAGALATAAVPDNGPKTKVELDLSSSQMAALRMLGLL